MLSRTPCRPENKGLKAYVCSICSKSYTQKHSLKKHLSTAHNQRSISDRSSFGEQNSPRKSSSSAASNVSRGSLCSGRAKPIQPLSDLDLGGGSAHELGSPLSSETSLLGTPTSADDRANSTNNNSQDLQADSPQRRSPTSSLSSSQSASPATLPQC